MRGSRKFCQRGSDSDNILIALKIVLPNAKSVALNVGHHQPASETFLWLADDGPTLMVFRWRADDDPTLIAGVVAL